MKKKEVFIKIILIIGTVLVWLPILAPVLLSVYSGIKERMFLFDYLMPIELFTSALVGGGLILWAALWARARRRLISWCFGIMLVLRIGVDVIGLALRESTLTGWWTSLLYTSIVAYSIIIVVIGVGGVLLLVDIFKSHTSKIL